MSKDTRDTIAAIATPKGNGGIGVVRVSGERVPEIAAALLGTLPTPRYAHFGPFVDQAGDTIDVGLALYFKAPHSFTGEDVLELQGHGGMMVMDNVLEAVLQCGARMAEPGEFSLRAYLNDKMDLAQAEAVCDLIHAATKSSARSAVRSLQGAFSSQVHALSESLVKLRVFVEASIDFSDEDIEFMPGGEIATKLLHIQGAIEQLIAQAQQGSIIRDGVKAMIVGAPNVGKSSLLNLMAQDEIAIVSDVPGTTRDVVKQAVNIDGLALYFSDTAGIRETQDNIEQAGIDKALKALEESDLILWVCDINMPTDPFIQNLLTGYQAKVIKVINKIDMPHQHQPETTDIRVSAKTGQGLGALYQAIKQKVGGLEKVEAHFTARTRHVQSLRAALSHCIEGYQQLIEYQRGELLAEELKMAAHSLGDIVGHMSADDLLGEIFSSFCIGK